MNKSVSLLIGKNNNIFDSALQIRREIQDNKKEEINNKQNNTLHYIITTPKMSKPSNYSTPQLIHTQSYKSPLCDLNTIQNFAKQPTYNTKPSTTLSTLQVNKQKVQRRNQSLLKLFRPSQHQQFNLQMLQKSPLMKTNQIFYYLVSRLKKQRQGMINVDIEQQRRKSPKPIQNKIREFLFHSLQESLLMSDTQLKETRYLQRLFQWFTDVFREREMKLGFRIEGMEKIDAETGMDEDWLIRNTYKSNMPLQLELYQRKMLNVPQLQQEKQLRVKGKEDELQSLTKSLMFLNSSPTMNNCTSYGQKKLYTLPQTNSLSFSKSTELLPTLNSRTYMSKLKKLRQQQQKQQLQVFESQKKKARAQYFEHTTKNYLETQKIRGNKLYDKSGEYKREKVRKEKENDRPFSLGNKVLEKIQAARLGVTCTQFRKNKENILKQNPTQTYNSPVFHTYLTTNFFHDIKKKRLDKIHKESFPRLFNKIEHNKTETEQSLDLGNTNHEIYEKELQNDKIYEILFGEREDQSEMVESIDGLGLSIIVNDKKEKGKRKKHEEKERKQQK